MRRIQENSLISQDSNASLKNIKTVKETLKKEATGKQSRFFNFTGTSKERKITILPSANIINEILTPID